MMTPDYDRLPVCDEFDELVKTGKAEYVTGENGEVFIRLDNGNLFRIDADGIRRIE